MRHAKRFVAGLGALALAAACSGKGRDRAAAGDDAAVGVAHDAVVMSVVTDATLTTAGAAIDAGSADAASDAGVAPGPIGPGVERSCVGGVLAPVLAAIREPRLECEEPSDRHHASARIGRTTVLVTASSSLLDPTAFTDGKRIDDSPTDTHSGGQWLLLERLEKRLGGRRALLRLKAQDLATLLGLVRTLGMVTYPRETIGRVAFTEAEAAIFATEWPGPPNQPRRLPTAVDPALVHLHPGEHDRPTVVGWYEKIEHDDTGECVVLHQIEATLDIGGAIAVSQTKMRERGQGCYVQTEPDPQNFFPD